MKSSKRLNPGENFLRASMPGSKKSDIRGTKEEHLMFWSRNPGTESKNTTTNIFPEDSACFSCLRNDRTGHASNDKLKDAFNITGLAHILSISGTHFGLLSVLLFGMVRLIIKALPYRILQRLTISHSFTGCGSVLPSYYGYLLGLSGASIPAVRSFLMIGLFLLGLLIGRKGFWLNSLLFAAFVIVTLGAEAILLSVFSALVSCRALYRFVHPERRRWGGERQQVVQAVRNALFMTLAAAAGTAPLVAYNFHYISVISPVSNLLVAPLIGFILIPMSVVAALFYLLTGYFAFSHLILIITEASIYLVEIFARIPFADIKIPGFSGCSCTSFLCGPCPLFVVQEEKAFAAYAVCPCDYLHFHFSSSKE